MDIPQKENQKMKIDNQLPESDIPQNDSEKTENVFQFAKKSRIFNWASWLVLGVAVLIAGGIVWWSWSGNKKVGIETKLDQFKVCQQNSDCVAVQDGCCGCGGGGKNIAINKKFEEEYSKKIQNECNNTGCISVISNDPSCSGIPVCDENKCDLAIPVDELNISALCAPEPPAVCAAGMRLTCANGEWSCKEIEENQDISNWKTYRNEEDGFEFKYPADFELNDDPITNKSPNPIWNSQDRKMAIISSASDVSFSIDIPKSFAHDPSKLKEIIIDGRKAYTEKYYINKDPNCQRQSIYSGLSSNTKVLQLIFEQFCLTTESNTHLDDNLITQILSTFKFLDSQSVVPVAKEIILTTDKKEYSQGETIKILIKNNLDKTIWFNAQFPSPPPPSPFRGISVEEAIGFSSVSTERFSNNVWENVSIQYGLIKSSPNEWIDSYASKLEPGKEYSFSWGRDYLSSDSDTRTGSYRIKLDYYTFDYAYAKKLTKRGTSIVESYQIVNGVKIPIKSPEGWEKAEKDGFKHTNFSNEFISKSKDASYKGCSTDNDCVIARPLCGNSQCLPGDKECSVGCGNVFAINKDNKNLWDMSMDNIKCLYPGPSCKLMPSPSSYYPICKNNLCEAIFKK